MGVPDSIKQMIEKQVDHLDANRSEYLKRQARREPEFSTLAVAAALGDDRAPVEVRCDELARQRHLIQDCGVHIQPNGEAVSRFGFIHASISERAL